MKPDLYVYVNEEYQLCGSCKKLHVGVRYGAFHAANQPDWREEGKIFVGEIMLKRGEYRIAQPK